MVAQQTVQQPPADQPLTLTQHDNSNSELGLGIDSGNL
jgi:hypothetical protein